VKAVIVYIFLFLSFTASAQLFSLSGRIINSEDGEGISDVLIRLENTGHSSLTDSSGYFELKNIKPGKHKIFISSIGYKKIYAEINILNRDIKRDFVLYADVLAIDSVLIKSKKDNTFGITRLKDVEGTAIYAGKKSEVIVLKDITANTATNNSRQIYSKIAGLNIFESDGAGIQLGIGGRGLNPQRVTNFNTRQNGYDMSADALGYPESYYSPPAEAIDSSLAGW